MRRRSCMTHGAGEPINLSSRAFGLMKFTTGPLSVTENRKSLRPRGSALMMSTAASDRGTRCVAFDLNRSGGTVQIFFARSNSDQRASATSLLRAPVSMSSWNSGPKG